MLIKTMSKLGDKDENVYFMIHGESTIQEVIDELGSLNLTGKEICLGSITIKRKVQRSDMLDEIIRLGRGWDYQYELLDWAELTEEKRKW